jgi:hypothetical protein
MRLWKHHPFYWSMGVRHILSAMVRLLEIAVETTKRSKELRVFQCIKGREFVVAEIAAQKRWCRIHKRRLKLFGVPLPFSLSS